MGFRDSLKALSEDFKEVEIGGEKFSLKKIKASEGLAMDGIEDSRGQMVASIRAGVVLEEDITDEEILSLAIEHMTELTNEVLDYNNLSTPEGEEAPEGN